MHERAPDLQHWQKGFSGPDINPSDRGPDFIPTFLYLFNVLGAVISLDYTMVLLLLNVIDLHWVTATTTTTTATTKTKTTAITKTKRERFFNPK